jgi:hypothetical protein
MGMEMGMGDGDGDGGLGIWGHGIPRHWDMGTWG